MINPEIYLKIMLMKKALLYHLFKLGAIPKKARPILEAEGILLADEGIGGWFISKNFKSPRRRCLYRKEGFSGCLILTKKRLLCYTYAKRQINIAIDDSKLSQLFIGLPKPEVLSLSFDAALFQENCSGILEFQFHTEKAPSFFEAFKQLGLSLGTPRSSSSAKKSRS